MRLYGIYQDGSVSQPSEVIADGTTDEWERVGTPVQDWPVQEGFRPSTNGAGGAMTFPAVRETVREISRHVEVQCDDTRLIDWMAGKE